MKLTFFGAAREVTGSCYYIEVNGKKMLIDCGLQQGSDVKENQKLQFNPKNIDYVILTHAHIDHSGRLPLLIKEGFTGKIFSTRATCDLISIMLRDSAHIQEFEAQWKSKKKKRAGSEAEEPLYTIEDAEKTLKYLVPFSYNEEVKISDGIKANFIDAGHLLGSASVELWLTENNITKKVVFSGDIGNKGQPIIRDPQYIKEADYVITESTYGDKDHEKSEDYKKDLAQIIESTFSKGGNVVIPAFAVGRTQELLYFIREIKERKLVKNYPDFQVYVDSPLASEATKIYDGDLKGYADEETIEILKNRLKPIKFENLMLCETVDASKALNEGTTSKVIISSSGMCDAGRIRHHLKHNLWREECAIVFVGYQANGTLGRILLDGVKKVKLFGEEIAVKAEIHNFRGLSAHADRAGLLEWISAFENKPEKVFVVHGENEVCSEYVSTLTSMGLNCFAPNFEAVYDLANNSIINEGIPHENIKKAEHAKPSSYAFARLLEAGERLLDVIKHNEGGANKDLAKFADQINSLLGKWER